MMQAGGYRGDSILLEKDKERRQKNRWRCPEVIMFREEKVEEKEKRKGSDLAYYKREAAK